MGIVVWGIAILETSYRFGLIANREFLLSAIHRLNVVSSGIMATA
jgi:hypothetical protein